MTLRGRLLVATIGVAVVAVVVTALAGLQLLRSADSAAARQQLAVQVEKLAAAGPAAREAIVDGLSQVPDGDVLVATVPDAGQPTGSASGILPKRVLVSLRAGRDVSTTVRSGGQTYLVEGRSAADGVGVVVAQSSERVLGLGSSVWPRLFLALGVGLVVAIIVALLLSGLLIRPLTRLAAAARRMAGGERAVRLEPTAVAEVADVEAALMALDAALARSEGRQREFLLSISHELRTPLTALRGYAEALRDGVIAPEDLKQVGGTMVAESDRLTAFTTDLLALARLEADDFSLDPADVRVAEVADEAADAWRASASTADVDLAVDVARALVVRTDRARLRQLLDGLIENALRVSPAGSAIRLAATAEPDAVVVSVTDGGPGLTPDDAAHAFERGALHARYRGSRPVGSGLGLSIAARLVERMGGTISAHSAPGAGAEFRIRLPRSVPDGSRM